MEAETPQQQQLKPNDNKLHPLGVVCHSYSPDFTMMAASIKEENVVNLYQIGDLEAARKWQVLATLKEHSQTVSVVDWSRKNQILTGSHDRSLFVWGYSKDFSRWDPVLVTGNKQNRAVLDGSWSPNGNKFCYSTGTWKVFLGFYEPTNNWWSSEALNKKKFASSVLCVNFHPSGRVVAAGSADFNVRLFTAYEESADKNDGYKGLFDDIKTKGEELYKVSTGCWVNALTWAPSGKWLAVSIHNSSFIFVKHGESGWTEVEDAITWEKLPFRSIMFANENVLVAGGYDYTPVKFSVTPEKGEFDKNYIREKKKDTTVKSQVKSNLAAFEKGNFGKGEKPVAAEPESERHTNPILCIKPFKSTGPGNVTVFSSNDIHGTLYFWTV